MKFLPNNILVRSPRFTTKNILNLFKGEKQQQPEEIPTQSVELSSVSRIEARRMSMPVIGLGTWQTMEGYVRNGKVKSLGVSNFNVHQVKTILNAAKVAPANVQVELHLYHQQKDMWKFCGENTIGLTAYTPLGSPSLTNFLLAHDLNISEISKFQRLPEARKHNKTAVQVLLRCLIQNGIAVIPKSHSPDRMVSKFDIFDFSQDDSELDELEDLDMGDKGRMFANICEGTESHKDYPFKINTQINKIVGFNGTVWSLM